MLWIYFLLLFKPIFTQRSYFKLSWVWLIKSTSKHIETNKKTKTKPLTLMYCQNIAQHYFCCILQNKQQDFKSHSPTEPKEKKKVFIQRRGYRKSWDGPPFPSWKDKKKTNHRMKNGNHLQHLINCPLKRCQVVYYLQYFLLIYTITFLYSRCKVIYSNF